jgi:hypothetical protein
MSIAVYIDACEREIMWELEIRLIVSGGDSSKRTKASTDQSSHK